MSKRTQPKKRTAKRGDPLAQAIKARRVAGPQGKAARNKTTEDNSHANGEDVEPTAGPRRSSRSRPMLNDVAATTARASGQGNTESALSTSTGESSTKPITRMRGRGSNGENNRGPPPTSRNKNHGDTNAPSLTEKEKEVQSPASNSEDTGEGNPVPSLRVGSHQHKPAKENTTDQSDEDEDELPPPKKRRSGMNIPSVESGAMQRQVGGGKHVERHHTPERIEPSVEVPEESTRIDELLRELEQEKGESKIYFRDRNRP